MRVSLPSTVYYVSQRGAQLRYGQRGGGLFARLQDARSRAARLRNQDASVKVFEGTVTWAEMDTNR